MKGEWFMCKAIRLLFLLPRDQPLLAVYGWQIDRILCQNQIIGTLMLLLTAWELNDIIHSKTTLKISWLTDWQHYLNIPGYISCLLEIHACSSPSPIFSKHWLTWSTVLVIDQHWTQGSRLRQCCHGNTTILNFIFFWTTRQK